MRAAKIRFLIIRPIFDSGPSLNSEDKISTLLVIKEMAHRKKKIYIYTYIALRAVPTPEAP